MAVITAFDAEAVRAAERARLAEVPEDSLMQRAAAALAVAGGELLRRHRGRVSGGRVVLLVGAGNNGGDALFAGRRLAGRGARVDAVLTGSTAHHAGLDALLAAGGHRHPAEQGEPLLAAADLVIDGLVGLGGKPGLREPAARLVERLPKGVPVLAVDLPSGVDPDSGETPLPHVAADVTVTFGAPKPCLLLPPASSAAGQVLPVDIGLDLSRVRPAVQRLEPADAAALWPRPEAAEDKYRRGVTGVVAGSAGYPGAAVLACSGALRAGTGMVRYLGPDAVAAHVLARWPEVVVGPGRVQAYVLGCGVDPEQDGGQQEAIADALATGLPCVLDAGALVLLGRGELELRPGQAALLTPHAGELARLLAGWGPETTGRGGPDRAEVEARPLHWARVAAGRSGAAVLIKGATTLVVTPDGLVRSQADAPAWTATAGAGDVLAGIAGALLAAGLDPLDAGSVAALVHGRAAARASGGGPIVAADIAAAVPATVAALLSADRAGR